MAQSTLRSGYLKVYMAPMNGGKTVRLWGDLTTNTDLGRSVCYINTDKDVRETTSGCDGMTTHHSSYSGESILIQKIVTRKLMDVDVGKFDVIGIDEANMYDDLLEAVLYWVDTLGKYVICSGLAGCRDRKLFGHLHELMPHWNCAETLEAVCGLCLDALDKVGFRGSISMAPAHFTILKENISLGPVYNEMDKNDESESSDKGEKEYSQERVGGNDDYVPVCRYHYLMYHRV